MRNRFILRLVAILLLVAQLLVLAPVVPRTAFAAGTDGETAQKKTPVPFAYSNAALQTESVSMGGVSYSDAIMFTMGYTGLSNGSIGEVTYNFKGKYQSLTFSAGYIKGHQRDATMTVIADGVVVKDAVKIAYTDVAKSHTISLAGVTSLTIRFQSDAYDKTYYGIANIKAVPTSGMKEEETLVSDEFYDIPQYQLQYTELIDGAFSMGGYDYENGYKMEMGYGFGVGYTAKVSFNFEGRYKKLSFDIAKYMNRISEPYTRSAYLSIEVDGQVLSAYDKKELKWNDVSLPVEVDLNGVSQVTISVNSDGYDRVNWALGNIQLVSDGHAHGILFDMDEATLTEKAPTVDLNPRVYPSDAANKNYDIVSDGESFASVDEEGIVTGHYKGYAVITATTEDGEYTAVCTITSKLPAFNLVNTYEPKYVDTTIDFTTESTDFVTIMGYGNGSVAGGLARAYEDAGRVITDGYGGLINGLDDVLDLNIEVKNDYDFLISDLMAGTMSTDIYTSLLNDEMLDAMAEVTTYLGGLVDIPSALIAQEAITDFGELPDVINTEVQARWAEVKKVFSSKVTYENAGKMFSVLGGAVDLASAVAEGCDDVGKLMEYYVLCNAFAGANDEYAEIIKQTAKKLEGENAGFSDDLSEAADTFAAAMENTTEKFPALFYVSCAEKVAEFGIRSARIASDVVDAIVDSVSVWDSIRTGVKIGTSLSNTLTAAEDRYYYGKMLRMAGFMAEGMHQVVLERQAAFEKSEKYEDAESLSAAIELYLNLQILACDYGIGYFQAHASALLGKVEALRSNALKDANALMSYKNKLQRLKDNARWIFFGEDGSINGFVIACPVTVIVETKDGTEIARLETGSMTVAEGYEWAYRLLGSEHEQKTGFYDPELHNVKIIAEGDGTMSIVDFSGTEDAITSGNGYYEIPVVKGEMYALDETHMVKDGQTSIMPDEVLSEGDFVNPFVDVVEGAYYYDAVMWAVQNDITNGTGENTFSPDVTCSRGQIVTFLWRACGSPKPAGKDSPFVDVIDGAYYDEAVLWAVEKGITNGTSDTTFSPEMACSRGQVVTFLLRAMGEEVYGASNPFVDVMSGQYYYDAVLWAVEKNITNGTSETTFSPDMLCSRGQIVTFLYRAMTQQ